MDTIHAVPQEVPQTWIFYKADKHNLCETHVAHTSYAHLRTCLGRVEAYRLESAEPASSSPNVEAVRIPGAVDGTRSNELNPQRIKVVCQLWPQPSSSDRVHDIGSAATTEGIVGLIECEQVLRLGG